ncbi:MAG: acyltransferase domain-containing protein, partial [Balneolia bacterium]|nr:acyltransferase domain-containing protein [Balneolia bacterium]
TKDGHCRAFDAKATGTIFGNGSGVVLLKRLDDAIADGDTVYAVIKSSAVNNDGAKKTDYTAPSVDGQTEVVTEALNKAGISAEDISYVETHGTGTFIGDPIEIRALTKAYSAFTSRKGFCGIGSVKPNIGHLDAGAGTAGLIKTVLALRNRLIPPSINFDEPNPALDIENTPFYVNSTLKKWESPNGSPLLAGVTSLGMGGTNAHLIVQEAPVVERPQVMDQWPLLLSWSAKKEGALDDYAAKLARFLKEKPEVSLANVAFSLQTGRKPFDKRRYLVADSREDAIQKLEKLSAVSVKTFSDLADEREVVFMFPGQASQYVNMGLDLYQNDPVFRKSMDECAELLKPLTGVDIRDLIYPEAGGEEQAKEQLHNTVYTQPAIFAIEYSLAMMWMDLGIKPAAVIGHSMGEFTAACIAGVFDLETGLKLIAMRGKIMQELEKGSMLTVMLSPAEAGPYLNERLSVSVINTPSSCVISGDDAAINELKELFDAKEINSRVLNTSHAFHSHMMDPVLETYRAFASECSFSAPAIPLLSTVTADWISAGEISSPDYWASNIRQPVNFAGAAEKLFEHPEWVLMEIGPGNTLSTLVRQHPDAPEQQIAVPSMRHPKQQQNDQSFALAALGRLWSCGYKVDWKRLYKENPVYRVSLPTYAFQRIRCWLDPETSVNGVLSHAEGAENGQAEMDAFGTPSQKKTLTEELTGIWEEYLGVENIKPDDNFFDLGGNSLVAVQLFDEIKRKLGVRLPLSTLFSAPTISEIAKVIEPMLPEPESRAEPAAHVQPEAAKENGTAGRQEQAEKKLSSVLVKIQGEGEGRPFFCIHGHFGNVLFFHKLAQLLGKDRPFYGVQSAGLSGEEDPITSIEAMAERIVTEMREVQPHGPYSFGGYCYGTLISREIVRLLDQVGETYDPVVMIDPHPPAYRNVLAQGAVSSFEKFSINQRKEKHGAEIGKRSVVDKLRYLAEKISWRVRFGSKVRALNAFIKLSGSKKRRMPAVFRDVELCNRVAHDNYVKKLSADFNADVELLIPKQISESYAHAPDFGWNGFTGGKMNIHLIEDDGQIMSGEMFKQPYVNKTAEIVKGIWNKKGDADAGAGIGNGAQATEADTGGRGETLAFEEVR